MRPEGCAIQYAAGGLDVLLDRRRPVVARATAVWAACSSKPGGTAGLWHRCRTGRDSALSWRCVSAWGPHLVGPWSDGTVDPRSWGFSSVPAHEYVVRDSASRLRALRCILAGQQDAVSPIRPIIWASAYGDEHSGIRRLEARWAARQAAQG